MVLSETEIQFQTSGLMTYWNSPPLRRISCHGKNHSHTRFEYL